MYVRVSGVQRRGGSENGAKITKSSIKMSGWLWNAIDDQQTERHGNDRRISAGSITASSRRVQVIDRRCANNTQLIGIPTRTAAAVTAAHQSAPARPTPLTHANLSSRDTYSPTRRRRLRPAYDKSVFTATKYCYFSRLVGTSCKFPQFGHERTGINVDIIIADLCTLLSAQRLAQTLIYYAR